MIIGFKYLPVTDKKFLIEITENIGPSKSIKLVKYLPCDPVITFSPKAGIIEY